MPLVFSPAGQLLLCLTSQKSSNLLHGMQQWPGVRLFLCFVDNDSQLMTSSLSTDSIVLAGTCKNHPRRRYLTGQKGLMHAKIIHVATLALLTQNKATTLQLLSI